jgi:serine/threonine-protein kinase
MPDLERLSEALAGRYRPVRELGRGGMAIVYLAHDLRHDRQVALKVLRPELAAVLGAGRFLNEIRITARLDHPHIVTLIDSGESGPFLWYVLPFIRGESLRDRLTREKQLRLDDAVGIVRAVAGALDYAHQRGVIHRDVKPENILLHEGEAMLADFGIALAVQEAGGERLTETGLSLGTPQYMSPEQASGDPDLDGRSDLYSLGCVLYEMLGGAPPFTGPNPRAILARHSLDPPPSLGTIRPGLPHGVERALATALAKAPADRFASAAAFADALKAPAAAPTARAVPRLRPRWAFAGLVALALALLGLWAYTRTGGPMRLESLAILPLANLSGDTAHVYLGEGIRDGLIGELGRVGTLRVISRTSTLRYRETSKSVPEIARELDVSGVVEGSFVQSDDSIRVRFRLIQAGAREREVWSNTYQEDLRGVVALQLRVAHDIAAATQVDLSPAERTHLTRGRTVDPAMYQAYLRGMFYVNQFTDDGFSRGLALLHEANAADPADPLPYVGLAQAYSVLGHGPRPDVLPRAKEAARKALELDPECAEAYAVLAEAYLYADWDWARARDAFQQSLRLNPHLAQTRAHHSWYLLLEGKRDESLAAMELAVGLDPLSPLLTSWLAWVRWWLGDNDGAIADARHSLELSPDFPVGWYVIGAASLSKGEVREAIDAHERLAATSPAWAWGLGYTLARTGREADARRIAAELSRKVTPMGTWGLMDIHAGLGDRDGAMRWLDSAIARRWSWVPWIGLDTTLTLLRDDPRFQERFRRLRLPSSNEGTGALPD